jgi:hypothetical protein
METAVEVVGRASLVLAGVVFMLALVLIVLWQVRAIWRMGKQLEQERELARKSARLPYTDSFTPPSFDYRASQ